MIEESDFVFPEPWWDLRGREVLEEQQRLAMAQRITQEVAQGHILYGRTARTIARCGACDEVLYEVDGRGYALVHLTWTHKTPEKPPWPATALYETWPEARAAVLNHEPDWEE